MDALRMPEAPRWQFLRDRIEQLEIGAVGLLSELGQVVPEWPFDRAWITKVALIEAESALRRALQAADVAVEIAQMADRITE
jgi:hypothetical protein